eukprot:9788931-Karenia_brevis.AAC.1
MPLEANTNGHIPRRHPESCTSMYRNEQQATKRLGFRTRRYVPSSPKTFERFHHNRFWKLRLCSLTIASNVAASTKMPLGKS